jgi:hypothetical protein
LGGDARYKKIIAKPPEIRALLIEEGVKAIPRKSREILLDFDATDDPLHGNQEGAFFHGYCYGFCQAGVFYVVFCSLWLCSLIIGCRWEKGLRLVHKRPEGEVAAAGAPQQLRRWRLARATGL